MNKLISVIIPTYNEEKNISDCLKTLLIQTETPREIIVVDDGSRDDTVNKIEAIRKESTLIRLFKQNHQGPAQARNLGAKKAKGGILVFVDGDMEFGSDFLKKLTAPIKAGQAKGTWSGREIVKNWQNVWARCWNYNYNRRQPTMTGQSEGQRKVFRAILKSEFERVEGFSATGYTDDWTLIDKLGYPPLVTSAEFFHHNPDSLDSVFRQAQWIGKRQYKLGSIGTLLAIIRANAGFSVIVGFVKSLLLLTPQFFLFKIVYDLGIMLGAIKSLAGKRY